MPPGSTAGFDVTLYLGILCVSTPVVFLVGSVTALMGSSLWKTVKNPRFTAAMGAFGGALAYLCINVVVALFSGPGVIASFFRSGVFLFPLTVGFVFGGCFGYALTYFSLRLGR
jgi:hypothetical protein